MNYEHIGSPNSGGTGFVLGHLSVYTDKIQLVLAISSRIKRLISPCIKWTGGRFFCLAGYDCAVSALAYAVSGMG